MSQAGYLKRVHVFDGSSTWHEVPATSASLDAGGDVLDDTTFMSGGNRSRIYGIRDWSLSLTLQYDTTDDAFITIRDAWMNREEVSFRYLPDGTNGLAGDGVVETFNMSGGVDDLETVDVTIQAASVLTAH